MVSSLLSVSYEGAIDAVLFHQDSYVCEDFVWTEEATRRHLPIHQTLHHALIPFPWPHPAQTPVAAAVSGLVRGFLEPRW